MFEHLRVVELASVLAGPMVGSFFAELGAHVIKVENNKTGGDVTRNWKLPAESKEQSFSAYYASANYKKKSLFLDLTSVEDYQRVVDLIRTADVLIVNFKPGDAKKLKLDFQTVQKVNPSIIYAELTGFGESDSRTAFDVVLQAETGFMSMNGERDARPLKMPVALIDILAAHQLKEGILCALIRRTKINRGSKVSVSLYDAALSSLANQATNYLMGNSIPTPMGSEHPNIAPYGDIFQTNDGDWIVLAIGTEKQFEDLCLSIDLAHLLGDEHFSTNAARVIYRSELMENISKAMEKRTTMEIEQLLGSKKIPFGRVKNLKEVFDHSMAQKLILEDTIDGHMARRVKTAIFKISDG